VRHAAVCPGPGGQHVNKTKTAALALLHAKLQAHAAQGRARGRAERRTRHVARPDGGVVRRFVGPGFVEGGLA